MDNTAASVHHLEATACMCAGGTCESGRAGHTVLAIQHRVAAASPTGWRDAMVDRVNADGWVELVFLADESRRWVWHHAPLGDAVAGAPVALHPAAGVVSVAGSLVSVLAGA